MKLILDFRERSTGGAVVPGKLFEIAHPNGPEVSQHLESWTVGKKVVFFTHGFNVDRPGGLGSLTSLLDEITVAPGSVMIGVLWPGDHWLGPLSYSFEGSDSDDTAETFASFINVYVAEDATLNFVSHSLGARVVMGTVEHLRALASPHIIEQVCLMAPAIDDHSLYDVDVFRPATRKTERVSILSSKKDNILKYAYPAGDLLQAFLFPNSDEFSLALGYHGPKRRGHPAEGPQMDINPKQIPGQRKSRHSNYLPPTPPVPRNQWHANNQSATGFLESVLRGEPGEYV